MNPKDRMSIEKAPLNLVPPAAIAEMAGALLDGAKKYGPYNWRCEQVKASIYYSAVQRHLLKWLDGDDIDAESGCSHLAHAMAGLAIIIDGNYQESWVDDRSSSQSGSKALTRINEILRLNKEDMDEIIS